MRKSVLPGAAVALGLAVVAGAALGWRPFGAETVLARAADASACPVAHDTLQSQLIAADTADTTGLNNHYWAVVVNREGVVCAVAFSGPSTDSQWLLSRQIAAAKAFTANGLSLDSAPLSTGQLYPWVQPGVPANPLFGLAAGNPVSAEDAYQGQFSQFGTKHDPMVGRRVGGTITFGGGLALYAGTDAIGGLGLPATPRAPIIRPHGGCGFCWGWRHRRATTGSRWIRPGTRIARMTPARKARNSAAGHGACMTCPQED
jgi:uncharacterized protein GlcG (DUF336 family)